MRRGQSTDATRRCGQAVRRRSIEGVQQALRDGGDPDEPLTVAAAKGYTDIVDLLLEAGASTTATDSFGQTALFMTGMCGSPTIAQRLINTGADVAIRTSGGHTPTSAWLRTKRPHRRFVRDTGIWRVVVFRVVLGVMVMSQENTTIVVTCYIYHPPTRLIEE